MYRPFKMSPVASTGISQSSAAPDKRRSRDRNRFAQALACALCLFGAAPAGAQEITAADAPAGLVRVSGILRVPNSCWILGPLNTGAPPQAPDIVNALPVTLQVDHTGGDMCAQVMAEHAFEGEFENRPDLAYVIVYLQVAEGATSGSPNLPERSALSTARAWPPSRSATVARF